jgi:hypothetical protein
MELCAIVTDVRPVGGYRLELTFSDGQQGVVDLSGRILGRRGDFQALADPAYFQQVRVDPELGTIVWPNHVDFCPDMLLDWVAAGRVPACEDEGTRSVV